MTISQRLTRAGLTFILLGTVAAVLPSQDENAFALSSACTTSGNTYAFGNSPNAATAAADDDSPHPKLTTGPAPGSPVRNRNLSAFKNGTAFTPTFSVLNLASTTSSSIGNTLTITGSTTNSTTGTVAATANFGEVSLTYYVDAVNAP